MKNKKDKLVIINTKDALVPNYVMNELEMRAKKYGVRIDLLLEYYKSVVGKQADKEDYGLGVVSKELVGKPEEIEGRIRDKMALTKGTV